MRSLRAPLGRRYGGLRRIEHRVAHCPTSNLRLGAGVAPVREYLDAGSGSGSVDGSASNERGDLMLEVKQALLVARGRGGAASDDGSRGLAPRTRGGAAVLGATTSAPRGPGRVPTRRLADPTASSSAAPRIRWRGSSSPAPHRVDRLVVEGEDVVRDGALVRADEDEIARAQRAEARRFAT